MAAIHVICVTGPSVRSVLSRRSISSQLSWLNITRSRQRHFQVGNEAPHYWMSARTSPAYTHTHSQALPAWWHPCRTGALKVSNLKWRDRNLTVHDCSNFSSGCGASTRRSLTYRTSVLALFWSREVWIELLVRSEGFSSHTWTYARYQRHAELLKTLLRCAQ